MRLIFIILGLASFSLLYGNEVTDYLMEYGKTGVSNYNREKNLISHNDLDKLIDKLTQFYTDTTIRVRQKAYYLTYKKAILDNTLRTSAIKILLKGCNDKDGGIIGQNLEFLKSFKLKDFDNESVQFIYAKLSNHRVQHYKDIVLLAGFVGTGKDILYQKMLDQNVSVKTKWFISLALARMGNPEQITYCLNKVKSLQVNENFLSYIIPDLIYMRQKEGLNFCIEILNSDDKLCRSLNPDNEESIICGYRVLEMLAPIVENIPVILDATGTITNGNSGDILNKVRKWFTENPNYQIRSDTF